MAGSTNFQQWNPLAINQETDIQYTADALRASGAPSNAIFPSPTANKLFYQVSIMCAALAQMLANKGYVVSDSNFAALVSVLTNIVTNADVVGSLVTVPFSATPVFNASSSTGFRMLLTNNVTSSTLTGLSAGKKITFVLQQDGAGGRSFVFPTNVHGAGTVDPTGLSVSTQEFIVDTDNVTLRPLTPMTVDI